MKELHVLLDGQHIGVLAEDDHGRHIFQYDADMGSGMALSLSMPVRGEAWSGRPVEAYIDGLLPDSMDVRTRIGNLYGVSPRNPFALLSAIGMDCGGAVQFITEEQLAALPLPEVWEPVDVQEIGERLSGAGGAVAHAWQTNRERWSLNGSQEKIALAYADGRNQWYEAREAAATTHIIKPGVSRLQGQAFNEYLCMRAVDRLGLPASVSSYVDFGGVSAIVSRRWDRDVEEEPTESNQPLKVHRIHQEDLCQATGVMSADKYQSDGGPGAVSIVKFMRDNGFAESSVDLFYSALIVNYLLCGTDAHAKNYAVLEREDRRPALAPLYDIASMYPYEGYIHGARKLKVAMKIGDEYRWRFAELRSWRKLAQLCGDSGDEDRILDGLRDYAQRLPQAFAEVAREEVLKVFLAYGPDDPAAIERMQVIQAIQAGLEAKCEEVRSWFDAE